MNARDVLLDIAALREAAAVAAQRNARDVLLRAVALIERDGWCQHEFHDPVRRHCLVGALGDEASEGYVEAFDALVRVVGTQSLTRWNDEPERTHEEVLDALRKAAAVAE